MSRSYRKNPVGTSQSSSRTHAPGGTSVVMKRFANKKVRRTKNIPNGKAYRKVFCSWDISDYKWKSFTQSPHLYAEEKVKCIRRFYKIEYGDSCVRTAYWGTYIHREIYRVQCEPKESNEVVYKRAITEWYVLYKRK